MVVQYMGQLRVGSGIVTQAAAPRTRWFRPSRRTVVIAAVLVVLVLGIVVPFLLVSSGGGHSHPKSAPRQSR